MANHENDQLYVTNPTSDYFEVKWGNYPYGVHPGQTVIFPRFIAEHFAKHLANHILLRKEKEYKEQYNKDKPFLNNRKERPIVVKSILTGTYQYFQKPGGVGTDPNAIVAQQVAAMINQYAQGQQPGGREPKPLNVGTIDTDPAIGALDDDDDDDIQTAPAAPMANAPVPPQQPVQPAAPQMMPVVPATPAAPPQTPPQQPAAPQGPAAKRTREELFAEAKQLGLKPKATWSNEELENAIKNF